MMSATMAKDMGHDVSRLLNPSPSFKHFVYDEKKIKTWADHLINDDLYVSDEGRNYESVCKLISWYLFGDAMNLTYEIGNGQGILAFSMIVPCHKARADWHMWDKSLWSATFARELDGVIHFVMDTFDLQRLYSHTANRRLAELFTKHGWDIEGTMRGDYRFHETPRDAYMIALNKEK
jgi:hypothetical protein